MSDHEDNTQTFVSSDPEDNYDGMVEQGACGGVEAFRRGSPLSDSVDNLSMEVQFGEGSSRHASEISSLSYQNLLDDGEMGGNFLARHESEDSADSFPVDYDDDLPPDDIDKVADSSDDQHSTLKRKSSSSRHNMEATSSLDKLGHKLLEERPRAGSEASSDVTHSDTDTVVSSGSQNIDSFNVDVHKKDSLSKRNSLEIRNNIPVVGEVKNYEKDINDLKAMSQMMKPQIRRQSPGLACRIGNESGGSGSDCDGSGSERELDKLGKSTRNRMSSIDKLMPAHAAIKRISPERSSEMGVTREKVDIENEYDYVKYARVHQGNSYVGMRLAYSSSNDSLNIKKGALCQGSLGSSSVDSSREGSPEKSLKQKHYSDFNGSTVGLQGHVNEETLTEIPLNGTDNLMEEELGTFSLSPENTECDSVEVESVTSEGKSSMGMPLVEDGLSSSQTSDTEETLNRPTDIIKQKQKAEVEQELANQERNGKPAEMDAQAIMDELKAKREALDLAIMDIKSAIHKSKGVALQSPYNEDQDSADPVWIKRDSFSKQLDLNEQKLRVQEEIERQCMEEGGQREHEEVFKHDSEHDHLLEKQFTRLESKPYQSLKGYDSDDEDHEITYNRRVKGQKYASVPVDESFDHSNGQRDSEPQSLTHTSPSDSSVVYRATTNNIFARRSRNNSDSQCSSDEYGSEGESPTHTGYVKTEGDFDTDEETDRLLQKQYQEDQYVDIPELSKPPINRSAQVEKRRSRAKEACVHDPDNPQVLIEGVLFRARYLGSTQLISEGQPSKAMRMMQAQEAVGRIKAPEGESQPSTEVDLFVSTEKIMVLNTDLQEIMMDHTLRTISYIADIGDILVIMARRRLLASPESENSLRRRKQSKILCHVFESDEAQLIAQSIGQAFQVAYMEFLKANGIEDPGLIKEMDYQDVLAQQEIFGEELQLFTNKELHKEAIVPKLKSEVIGIVIVESGWGSMVPTVVLANMMPNGPAARCGQLNIGDQIISINGVSLVGLPLSTCQSYIKATKNQTVVKLTVVPCPPVVEVLIKRPDVKYQLGFSVQNGVICSLLRGGIAERGGVRVGHRIIEINNQSVVAVPHEKIVALLANSVGEIHMKTMPTSIFRLLTGQETPHYL